MTQRDAGQQPARPRRSAFFAGLRTFGLMALIMVDALRSASFVGRRSTQWDGLLGAQQASTTVVGLFVVVGAGLAVGAALRDRFPVQLAVLGTAAVLVIPIGATAALIGLTAVVRLRPRATSVPVAVLVAAGTAVSVWRDINSVPHEHSFWGTVLSTEGFQPAHWSSVPIVTGALLGLSIGIGVWLRVRAELATATEQVDVERQQVSTLTSQMSRQAERERLAREIHDGLGHRLSILSVHAGALQAAAAVAAKQMDDATAAERVAESAQIIRESAAASVNELHELLDLLRHPDDPDVAAPAKTLRDVSALVDEAVASGMPLAASIELEDAEGADPQIGQACFRITQELLTNARKHAPGLPVRYDLAGGPTAGELAIATANRLPNGDGTEQATDEARHTGTGLIGIQERAEYYGGTLSTEVDDAGVFHVGVRLPWSPTTAHAERTGP